MVMKENKGYRQKQRNTGSRKERSIVLLSTEGKNKTETRYFTDLARYYGLNIKFAPGNYTDPVNMIKALQQKCSDLNLDAEHGDIAEDDIPCQGYQQQCEQLPVTQNMLFEAMSQCIAVR